MIWRTREGEEMPIMAMGDQHLLNTIAYLKRIIEERGDRQASAYSFASGAGEMASYYAEAHADQLGEQIGALTAARFAMIKEARIRGLNPYEKPHRKVPVNFGRPRTLRIKWSGGNES